jgi:hypothetical protein
MSIVMGARSAPGADHGRVGRHNDRRDRPVARAAGGPGGCAAVPGPLSRPAARGGVGGDHGLALRGPGVASDRRRRASRRAGGDRRAAGAKEAPQDRSRGRPASARAVDGRPAAGVVDPARAHPRPARTRAVAAHAGRSARRVAAADSRGALPPRLSAPQRHRSAYREGSRVAGRPRAAANRARAGHRRAADDRHAGHPARADR